MISSLTNILFIKFYSRSARTKHTLTQHGAQCGLEDKDGVRQRVNNLERLVLSLFNQINPAAALASFHQAQSLFAPSSSEMVEPNEAPETVDMEDEIEVISINQQSETSETLKIEVEE